MALPSTGIDHNKIPEDNSNIKFYWNPSNSLRHTVTPPLCNTFMFWTLCRVESVRSLRLLYNCNVFYLLQVLYRELGLTASKLSFKHRHPGTSKEALMQIKRDHPLPEIILQWRKLNSILTKVLWIWWSLLIPCSNSWTYKFMKESCTFIIYVVWYWLQMNVLKLQSKLISGNWKIRVLIITIFSCENPLQWPFYGLYKFLLYWGYSIYWQQRMPCFRDGGCTYELCWVYVECILIRSLITGIISTAGSCTYYWTNVYQLSNSHSYWTHLHAWAKSPEYSQRFWNCNRQDKTRSSYIC